MKTKLVAYLLALLLVPVTFATNAVALTDAELAQLAQLSAQRAQELLAPAPAGLPFGGHTYTGTQEIPPPNCVNPRVFDRAPDPITHMTHVRWLCDGNPPPQAPH